MSYDEQEQGKDSTVINWPVSGVNPDWSFSDLKAHQVFAIIKQAMYEASRKAGLELQSSRADAVARLLKG